MSRSTSARRRQARTTAGVVRWLLAVVVVATACTLPPVSGAGCGPLTATEPPSLRDRIYLRLVRRIDVAVRLDDAEWCIAGVRVFDGGAELVGRDRRSPPGPAIPWRAAQVDVRAVTITIRDAGGTLIHSSETVSRDDRVRLISIPAPVLGPSDPVERLHALETTPKLVLEAPLLRTVGPASFAPIAIAGGAVDTAVDIGGVSLRLSTVRILPGSIAVSYRRLGERLPAPYLDAVLFSAVDDAGTVYRYRGDVHLDAPDPLLYAFFEPAPPPTARTLTITVERLFAPTGETWRVELPFRRSR